MRAPTVRRHTSVCVCARAQLLKPRVNREVYTLGGHSARTVACAQLDECVNDDILLTDGPKRRPVRPPPTTPVLFALDTLCSPTHLDSHTRLHTLSRAPAVPIQCSSVSTHISLIASPLRSSDTQKCDNTRGHYDVFGAADGWVWCVTNWPFICLSTQCVQCGRAHIVLPLHLTHMS
jgi:hypothetical protein